MAHYHSSRSARDRDRLRQNVVEAHGWVLHRIWSTDWFHRPEEETAKVVKAIEAAKAHWRETDERAADSISAVPIRFTAHEEGDVVVVVGEVLNERSDVPRYEKASFAVNRRREPHETPLPEMLKYVVRVVSVEGPIHESEIVVRIRSLWGLARAGNRIRDAVLARRKGCQAEGRYRGWTILLSVGPASGRKDRSEIDSNSLRKPEYLPAEEVKLAIGRVVAENFGVRAGTADPGCCTLVWLRIYQRANSEAAVTDLLDAGQLRLDGRLISPVRSETVPS
nr:DUF3320 domain-containing protein [Bradyrhizobium sp. 33ap4]